MTKLCSEDELVGEWNVAPLRRVIVVLTDPGDEGVIADDVVFVVRRGLESDILTGQIGLSGLSQGGLG
jgi:hypothetical protein